MYQGSPSRSSCCLAKSASISANVTAWNARSQAANHGYSHLSGMEKMSQLLKCVQSELRPLARAAGGGGCAGSPFSQVRTS